MQVPLVDLRSQYAAIKPEIDAAVERVLNHAGFILGSEVASFEKAFTSYIGTKQAVGVASGTGALRLALQACGIGPGDEVITTAHTFFATAEAISRSGARPVFVDIDERTYNLDPNRVEDLLKSRSVTNRGRIRAIMPVHLYGQPADMDPIMELAHAYGLWVIEDSAQAHGADYKGRRCGSIGHLGCFSFYPGKNLGAYGDGGAVTGNDESLISKVRKLRDHGRSTKYEHEMIGFGERLDALQAAILSVKLAHLEDWTEGRRAHAVSYDSGLRDCDLIRPYAPEYLRHVYHLYVIRTENRDKVLAHLKASGIGAGTHYPVPLHRQPAYLDLGYGTVSLPITEKVASEVLSLPMYPELSQEQIDFVVQVLKEGMF